MPLHILVADTYYDRFLDDYHLAHAETRHASYAERRAHLMAQRFGTGDACATELGRLGCDPQTIVLNDNALSTSVGKGTRRHRPRDPRALASRDHDGETDIPPPAVL